MQHIKIKNLVICLILHFSAIGCGKQSQSSTLPPAVPPPAFVLNSLEINGTAISINAANYGIARNAVVKLYFNAPVEKASVTTTSFSISEYGVTNVPASLSYEKNDSVVVLTATASLKGLTKYFINADNSIQSTQKSKLLTVVNTAFITQIDSSDKFTAVSDNELLDLVQKQTFKYFWDFGHPVSGLARERNNGNNEVVTTGGSGFGIMTIPIAINRNFITRAQGLARMQIIVGFLKDKAARYHGAFPHWINGTDGSVIPFSTKDDGADLVETSYLMAGLLTARQYFNGTDPLETNLRNDINTLWDGVEWAWFRQSNQNVLYWHWSPKYNWEMNHKIEGWNECLITYILAASANKDSIPSIVYKNGFARNGAMVNGNTYYGSLLPLGSAQGGPLFFSHYSFLGINPNGLTDQYANYQTQVVNHSKINYSYCVANPLKNYGYSNLCWGLTASDIPNGYTASEPNNDVSVIAPTAAISSMPYTPVESMNALKFFYYKLGDKLFKEYGFVDAFSLQQLWYANSALAIDQGPEMIMIENYRSQLIWNLLSNTPEIKRGMQRLGFTAPYL